MKRQFEDFAMGAGKSVNFEVKRMSVQEMLLSKLEGKDIFSILPTINVGEYAEDVSVYVDGEGNKAVVPPGWVVSMIDSENAISTGLVIYRIPKEHISWRYLSSELYVNEFVRNNYDQLVWIPMKFVEADGTLNGHEFTEKFGRRYSNECNFSEYEYHEEIDDVLRKQISSVKKYGGYYISRYDISHSDMVPRSISQQDPWRLINFYQAKLVAGSFEIAHGVKSHLMYGSEFDTMRAWVNQTAIRTQQEYPKAKKNDVDVTGKSVSMNNIYDLDVLVEEWTQEMYENAESRVLRGGQICTQSKTDRMAVYARSCTLDTGFRIAICID